MAFRHGCRLTFVAFRHTWRTDAEPLRTTRTDLRRVAQRATRNELQRAAGNDRQALEDLADVLRERGWTCWLYERVPAVFGSLTVPGRSERFETLREWKP